MKEMAKKTAVLAETSLDYAYLNKEEKRVLQSKFKQDMILLSWPRS